MDASAAFAIGSSSKPARKKYPGAPPRSRTRNADADVVREMPPVENTAAVLEVTESQRLHVARMQISIALFGAAIDISRAGSGKSVSALLVAEQRRVLIVGGSAPNWKTSLQRANGRLLSTRCYAHNEELVGRDDNKQLSEKVFYQNVSSTSAVAIMLENANQWGPPPSPRAVDDGSATEDDDDDDDDSAVRQSKRAPSSAGIGSPIKRRRGPMAAAIVDEIDSAPQRPASLHSNPERPRYLLSFAMDELLVRVTDVYARAPTVGVQFVATTQLTDLLRQDNVSGVLLVLDEAHVAKTDSVVTRAIKTLAHAFTASNVHLARRRDGTPTPRDEHALDAVRRRARVTNVYNASHLHRMRGGTHGVLALSSTLGENKSEVASLLGAFGFFADAAGEYCDPFEAAEETKPLAMTRGMKNFFASACERMEKTRNYVATLQHLSRISSNVSYKATPILATDEYFMQSPLPPMIPGVLHVHTERAERIIDYLYVFYTDIASLHISFQLALLPTSITQTVTNGFYLVGGDEDEKLYRNALRTARADVSECMVDADQVFVQTQTRELVNYKRLVTSSTKSDAILHAGASSSLYEITARKAQQTNRDKLESMEKLQASATAHAAPHSRLATREVSNTKLLLSADAELEMAKVPLFARLVREQFASHTTCKVVVMLRFVASVEYLANLLASQRPMLVTGSPKTNVYIETAPLDAFGAVLYESVPPKQVAKRFQAIEYAADRSLADRLILATVGSEIDSMSLHDEHGSYPRYTFATPTYQPVTDDKLRGTTNPHRTGVASDSYVTYVFGRTSRSFVDNVTPLRKLLGQDEDYHSPLSVCPEANETLIQSIQNAPVMARFRSSSNHSVLHRDVVGVRSATFELLPVEVAFMNRRLADHPIRYRTFDESGRVYAHAFFDPRELRYRIGLRKQAEREEAYVRETARRIRALQTDVARPIDPDPIRHAANVERQRKRRVAIDAREEAARDDLTRVALAAEETSDAERALAARDDDPVALYRHMSSGEQGSLQRVALAMYCAFADRQLRDKLRARATPATRKTEVGDMESRRARVHEMVLAQLATSRTGEAMLRYVTRRSGPEPYCHSATDEYISRSLPSDVDASEQEAYALVQENAARGDVIVPYEKPDDTERRFARQRRVRIARSALVDVQSQLYRATQELHAAMSELHLSYDREAYSDGEEINYDDDDDDDDDEPEEEKDESVSEKRLAAQAVNGQDEVDDDDNDDESHSVRGEEENEEADDSASLILSRSDDDDDDGLPALPSREGL